MSKGLPMTNRNAFYISSLAIVPVLFALFYGLRFVGRAYGIDQWVPKWDTLLILAVMIVVEDLHIQIRRFAKVRSGPGCDIERRQSVGYGHSHGSDRFTNTGILPGALFGPQTHLG